MARESEAQMYRSSLEALLDSQGLGNYGVGLQWQQQAIAQRANYEAYWSQANLNLQQYLPMRDLYASYQTVQRCAYCGTKQLSTQVRCDSCGAPQ